MPTTTATKPRRAKRNHLTELLAQVLAPAGEAITVADIEGYIIEANDAVETVYRWPRAEILGQHALKFCPETDYWPKLSTDRNLLTDRNFLDAPRLGRIAFASVSSPVIFCRWARMSITFFRLFRYFGEGTDRNLLSGRSAFSAPTDTKKNTGSVR